MNKWYFSKDNKVTEPMDFEAAKKYVVANLDSYGWQQSYSQWLPLHCISEFASIVPPVKPLAIVPQKVVDEFNNKSQNLVDNLSKVNADISDGESTLEAFAQEIATYKQMTLKLSPEVQANINGIEQQYNLLHQQLIELKQSTNQTANEVSDVVNKFNLKLTSNSAAPLAPDLQKDLAKQITKSENTTPPVLEDEIDKAIREKLKISLPDLSKKPSDQEKSADNTKEASPQAKSSESPEEEKGEKIVNIRPPRPAGAKVISTRSNKPGAAHFINSNTPAPTKAESSNEQPADKQVSAKKTEENEPKKPNVKVIGGIEVVDYDDSSPTTSKSEETAAEQRKAHKEAEKIKDKIGAGVKNIFSSMFHTESPSPSISAGLKELAKKKEAEKQKELAEKEEAEKQKELENKKNEDDSMEQKRIHSR